MEKLFSVPYSIVLQDTAPSCGFLRVTSLDSSICGNRAEAENGPWRSVQSKPHIPQHLHRRNIPMPPGLHQKNNRPKGTWQAWRNERGLVSLSRRILNCVQQAQRGLIVVESDEAK